MDNIQKKNVIIILITVFLLNTKTSFHKSTIKLQLNLMMGEGAFI